MKARLKNLYPVAAFVFLILGFSWTRLWGLEEWFSEIRGGWDIERSGGGTFYTVIRIILVAVADLAVLIAVVAGGFFYTRYRRQNRDKEKSAGSRWRKAIRIIGYCLVDVAGGLGILIGIALVIGVAQWVQSDLDELSQRQSYGYRVIPEISWVGWWLIQYVPPLFWIPCAIYLFFRRFLSVPGRTRKISRYVLDIFLFVPSILFLVYAGLLVIVNYPKQPTRPHLGTVFQQDSAAAKNYIELSEMIWRFKNDTSAMHGDTQAEIFDFVIQHPLAFPNEYLIYPDSLEYQKRHPWAQLEIMMAVKEMRQRAERDPANREKFVRDSLDFMDHYPTDTDVLIGALVGYTTTTILTDSLPLFVKDWSSDKIMEVDQRLSKISGRLRYTLYPLAEYSFRDFWLDNSNFGDTFALLARWCFDKNATFTLVYNYYDELTRLGRRPYYEIHDEYETFRGTNSIILPPGWMSLRNPVGREFLRYAHPKMVMSLDRLNFCMAHLNAVRVALAIVACERRQGRPMTGESIASCLGDGLPKDPWTGKNYVIDVTKRVVVSPPREPPPLMEFNARRPVGVRF